MLTRHPNQPPITDYPLPITSLPAYPPSPSIRIHPRSIPALRNLSLCAKKWAKISNRGGNELEDLREIRHFLHSNLKIFPYFLQKPRAEPEYLRLALSKTRFSSAKNPSIHPRIQQKFNALRQRPPHHPIPKTPCINPNSTALLAWRRRLGYIKRLVSGRSLYVASRHRRAVSPEQLAVRAL